MTTPQNSIQPQIPILLTMSTQELLTGAFTKIVEHALVSYNSTSRCNEDLGPPALMQAKNKFRAFTVFSDRRESQTSSQKSDSQNSNLTPQQQHFLQVPNFRNNSFDSEEQTKYPTAMCSKNWKWQLKWIKENDIHTKSFSGDWKTQLTIKRLLKQSREVMQELEKVLLEKKKNEMLKNEKLEFEKLKAEEEQQEDDDFRMKKKKRNSFSAVYDSFKIFRKKQKRKSLRSLFFYKESSLQIFE